MATLTLDLAGPRQQTPGPGWLDGSGVLAAAPGVCRTVVLPIGTVVQILGNNPDRVGFMMFKPALATNFPRVSPIPDVATFGLRASPDLDVRTFVLQDWLSMMAGDWWALADATMTVMVCEFQPRF